jgi:hypothetical protein
VAEIGKPAVKRRAKYNLPNKSAGFWILTNPQTRLGAKQLRKNMDIEVELSRIIIDEASDQQVIVLKEKKGMVRQLATKSFLVEPWHLLENLANLC